MIVARYTLSIHTAVSEERDIEGVLDQLERTMAELLIETEENLTDLLPEGWTATIEVKE